ncbi:MAG: hypothetical protein J6S63_03145 [Atopobiaceae bacterium]|nr:hypothetical protein [Atopobiaceae bacterium]
MQKRLTTIMAAALLAGSLALPACGGNATSGSAAGQGAGTEQATTNLQDQFVGAWKVGAAQQNGVTLTGDLSAFMQAETGMTLEIKDDGTGSFALGEQSIAFTWKLDGSDIELTFADDDPDKEANWDSKVARGSLEGETLTLDMEDILNAKLLFSKTGTIDGIFVIDAASAAPITSEDQVPGEWKLSGMNIMGLSVYGDADALSAMSGQSLNANLTLNEDGTGALSEAPVTWTTDKDGTTLTSVGVELPLKSVDDTHVVLDMSSLLGTDLTLLYTK